MIGLVITMHARPILRFNADVPVTTYQISRACHACDLWIHAGDALDTLVLRQPGPDACLGKCRLAARQPPALPRLLAWQITSVSCKLVCVSQGQLSHNVCVCCGVVGSIYRQAVGSSNSMVRQLTVPMAAALLEV